MEKSANGIMEEEKLGEYHGFVEYIFPVSYKFYLFYFIFFLITLGFTLLLS